MKRLFILTTIALAFCTPFASGKLLDPNSKPNAILDAIMKKIDPQGIDVLRNWDSNSPIPGKRVILAPLKGFESSAEVEKSKAAWMNDFEGDVHSFLAGYETKSTVLDKGLTDFTKFTRKWDMTPRPKRVFISFTQADVMYANNVKKALEGKGYKTFIFLSNPDQNNPLLKTKEAGHLFATAGHHFVIDSKNARKSSGVWFEQELLRRDGGSSSPDLGRPDPPPPEPNNPPYSPPPEGESPPYSPSSEPDSPPYSSPPSTKFIGCICKKFRNNRLVNSYQIPPGARCGMQICGPKTADP
jgi:hypothetical protein